MHHDETMRSEARRLYGESENATSVARQMGLPRSTVWDWVKGDAEQAPPRPPTPYLEAIVAREVRKALEAMNAPPGASQGSSLPTRPPSGLVKAAKPYSRVGIISDLHIPYHDPDAVNCSLEFLEHQKPDLIVINGDYLDFLGPSRWMKHPRKNVEILAEFDIARPITERIDRIGSDVIYVQGNHEDRLPSLIANNPSLYGLLDLKQVAKLPERWTVYPDQTHLRLGQVLILHGNLAGRGTGAKHIAHWMYSRVKSSCVFGHFHRTQSYFEPTYDGEVRGAFAVGWLGLPEHADYVRCPDWSQGFAWIDMDHEQGLFEIRNHVISNGKARIDGRTFGR